MEEKKGPKIQDNLFEVIAMYVQVIVCIFYFQLINKLHIFVLTSVILLGQVICCLLR